MAGPPTAYHDNLLPLLQPPPCQGHGNHTRIFDYRQKYPADKEGRELEPDSRTWKVYINEHESYDYDMVRGFRDNIDALLVFAALFSSIVTGFVVPAAERLEPDEAQINNSLLLEVTRLLRANGNATLIGEVPHSELRPGSVTHNSEDVWVACLFFSSLALSLGSALVSILVKQWLQAFTALGPGDAKQRSLKRQFRFGGMQRWKFSEIVGFLPLLLHLALAIFFVGLCVYVSRSHKSILASIGSVAAAAVVFYVVTSALPAVYLDCPYRVPILFVPASACVYAWKILQFVVVNQICGRVKRLFISLLSANGRAAPPPDHISRPSFVPSPLAKQEHDYIKQNTSQLELSSLEWLYTQTTNTSVRRTVLPGLARVLTSSVASPIVPPPSPLLEDMHSFALPIINTISGSESIDDDIPQLLDFHLCMSEHLQRQSTFPVSRWPLLIQSPHLRSFLDRRLLPLDATFSVESGMNVCEGHPLHIACYLDRWEVVEWLLRRCPGSHFTTADNHGWLPLGRAASSNNVSNELWGWILYLTGVEGHNVAQLRVNHREDTVLHVLCERLADLAKIKYLSRHFSWLGLNLQREDGKTSLHVLCEDVSNVSRRTEIAQYLLSEGADLRIGDGDGLTPLHLACRAKLSEHLVQMFCTYLQNVKSNRDFINQPSKYGWTPLHFACAPYNRHSAESSQIIQVLISAGADPNLADVRHKNLPLHLACTREEFYHQRMNPDVIDILLDSTVDINARNSMGQTPLDVLVRWKFATDDWRKAYHLMRNKGARLGSELERIEQNSRDWIGNFLYVH